MTEPFSTPTIVSHGLSGTLGYSTWVAMQKRCYSPSGPDYHRYGGRGIKVCQRWMDPAAFIADMGQPPPGMSIGRIDNDGDYEPGNCRWETQEQQNENTCRNRYLTWNGKTQTVKAWGQELDMEPKRISERLRRGWTVERALTTPCSRGYEEGRRLQLENSRRNWAASGRVYEERSDARRKGDAPPRKPAATGRRPAAPPRAVHCPHDPELAVATGLMAQALADDPHRAACIREALATTAGRQALGLALLAALLDSGPPAGSAGTLSS